MHLAKQSISIATLGALRSRPHRRFNMARKTPAVRIACSAAFLVLALALVPAALAGKGGKPGGGGGGNTTSSGSLSLVLLNSTDGLPHRGQQVTFQVSTSYATPSISLDCY